MSKIENNEMGVADLEKESYFIETQGKKEVTESDLESGEPTDGMELYNGTLDLEGPTSETVIAVFSNLQKEGGFPEIGSRTRSLPKN